MTDNIASSLEKNLERLARRCARAKIDCFMHASVYVLVNLFLAALSASSGGLWRLALQTERGVAPAASA